MGPDPDERNGPRTRGPLRFVRHAQDAVAAWPRRQLVGETAPEEIERFLRPSLAAQSLDARRPHFPRWIQRLQALGVTAIPFPLSARSGGSPPRPTPSASSPRRRRSPVTHTSSTTSGTRWESGLTSSEGHSQGVSQHRAGRTRVPACGRRNPRPAAYPGRHLGWRDPAGGGGNHGRTPERRTPAVARERRVNRDAPWDLRP